MVGRQHSMMITDRPSTLCIDLQLLQHSVLYTFFYAKYIPFLFLFFFSAALPKKKKKTKGETQKYKQATLTHPLFLKIATTSSPSGIPPQHATTRGGLRMRGGEAGREPGGENIPSPASAKLASVDDVAKYVSVCGGVVSSDVVDPGGGEDALKCVEIAMVGGLGNAWSVWSFWSLWWWWWWWCWSLSLVVGGERSWSSLEEPAWEEDALLDSCRPRRIESAPRVRTIRYDAMSFF